MLQAVWQITLELAPWMIFGALVAGALHAFLPAGSVSQWLGGRGAVWKSVLVGIPLPLCSCAVIPVGIGLKRQGASAGSSVAFLVATPQTGVDSILVSAGVLGWPLTLFKVGTAMVTGLVSGWTTDLVVQRKLSLPVLDNAGGPKTSPSFGQRVRGGLKHADDLVQSIWRWLVIGVLVSAAITAGLPEGWLQGLTSYGPVPAMVVALLVSLPLYVCATASVPIAASLVASGMPLGAAIVFLMAGPATNLATMGAVYRGLGGRALTAYLTTLILGSVLGALLFEAWLTANAWTLDQVAPCCTTGQVPSWWQIGSAVVFLVWIAWCALRDPSGSHNHTEAI